MRIRSLSPEYLDVKGLVALRRETLLARHVLLGKTTGYKNHPQLKRFKKYESESILFLDTYLKNVYLEAQSRGYRFDKLKFGTQFTDKKIPVTIGQVEYERNHLIKKLDKRDEKMYDKNKKLSLKKIRINTIFEIIDGPVEDWEKI